MSPTRYKNTVLMYRYRRVTSLPTGTIYARKCFFWAHDENLFSFPFDPRDPIHNFMNLQFLDIPSEVWQRILFDWITLPEVVRFDLAVTSFSINPFNCGYSDHHFSFTNEKFLRAEYLSTLLAWFKLRNVHLKYIFVGTNDPTQWNQIFEWTGRTVRNLTINGVSEKIVQSAGLFCTNLEALSLQYCLESYQPLYDILANNATTLRSFELAEKRIGTEHFPELPALQISNLSIRTFSSVLIPILSKCTDLSVLRCKGTIVDLQLANCLASSCQKSKASSFGLQL